MALGPISAYTLPMPTTLPIDQMTWDEKLRLMEALWADLSRHADAMELPDWHAQALRETEQRVADGKETAVDWETAKNELRQRFS
jgi:hypothetical protein